MVWYALFLAASGRWDEAMAKARMAVAVDPLSPYTHAQEGIASLFYGGFHGGASPEAIDALEKAAAMDPDHTVALYTLGMAYGRARRHDRAIETLNRVVELTGRTTYYLAVLAWAHGNAGRPETSRSILQQIYDRAASEYVGPMIFAFIYSGLREPDLAMEWLSRAEAEHSPTRVWLGLPLFDNLRDDPRFAELLGRLWRR